MCEQERNLSAAGRRLARVGLACLFVLAAVGATAQAGPFEYSHSITTPYWSGHGLVHDGTDLVLQGGNNIYRLDPADGTVRDQFYMGSPHGLAYDGSSMFTVISAWNIPAKLREFDPVTGATINEIPDVAPLSNPTFLNGQMYACGDYDEINRIDPATGAVLGTIPAVGFARDNCIYWSASALCAYGDNLLAVVSINLDNAIVVELDPTTGDRQSVFKLYNFTQGVRAIATDGTRLYTTGVVGYDADADGSIHVYDPAPAGTPWATAIAAPGQYYAAPDYDLALDATWSMASSGIASYEWDVNNDGTYDLTGLSPTASFSYLQDTLGMTGRWNTVKLKVTAADGTVGYDYAGLELYEVPEPATVVLLGLGSLTLLRRKR